MPAAAARLQLLHGLTAAGLVLPGQQQLTALQDGHCCCLTWWCQVISQQGSLVTSGLDAWT